MVASVLITTHWVNGWFLRLFSRPYFVMNEQEFSARWGKAMDVSLPDGPVRLCAGVRYFNRGPLLGCEPETVDFEKDHRDDTEHGSESLRHPKIVFRNGFWNHSPFRVVS